MGTSAPDSTLPEGEGAAALADFFAPGVAARDLPELTPLLAARGLLGAFIAVFRGGEDEVLVRLLVLREIGNRPDDPRWSPQELARHFAFLDPVKLDTVLKRLREYGLLLWDTEDRSYQLSGAGRIALSALANIIEAGSADDADLAYITSQVAAGHAMGRISLEALHLLLTKYRELEREFDDALVSGSEFRIRRARAKFDVVEKTVRKGNEIMGDMMAAGGHAGAMYRNAQAIGQAQSRILRMHAAFQRTLNAIELQRVHLGGSGLSSSDVADWLRGLDATQIAALMPGAAAVPLQLPLLVNDVLLDSAEYELIDRQRATREETPLPPPCDAPQANRVDTERMIALERYLERLEAIDVPVTLAETVVEQDYAHAAYRLSLLALLGDPESAEMRGPVAALARLPLRLALTGDTVAVHRADVAEISAGELLPDTGGAT